ncbi:MAG: sensor histidine kinase [Myxococcota bacterium]
MGQPARQLAGAIDQKLWDEAPCPLFRVVAGGVVAAVNPAALARFPAGEPGVRLSSLLDLPAEIDEAVEAALAGVAIGELMAIRPRGQRIKLHLGLPEGPAWRGVVVWVMESDAPVERAESVSETVAMLAHQLRSPLASVRGSSELLRRYGSRLGADHRLRALDRIEASVGLMTEILEDLLLAGRITSGRAECNAVPLELVSVVRQFVEGHAAADRVDLVADAGWVPVCADRALLRHVVDNLVGNAAKYDPSGARITVEVSRVGDRALFRVLDRGIGIAADEHKAVFAPFTRGSNVGAVQGTGLGLSLVQTAVRAMGGQVELDSAPNEGTSVRVNLPLGTASPHEGSAVDNFED